MGHPARPYPTEGGEGRAAGPPENMEQMTFFATEGYERKKTVAPKLPETVKVVRVSMVKENTIPYETQRLLGPLEAVPLFRKLLGGRDRECMAAIHLNCKNRINSVEIVSIGTLNSSPAHPREVFKGAILANAAAIVLGHNHPSGDPTPSKEDIEVTRRLVEAGNILGIQVLDHIIIADDGWVSLKERLLMPIMPA
ncbi:MAG: repair protein RadC [Thermoanaerobacter sp.]|nr:repair protein RadC [Thermoanaerobacter sp.]GEA14838.1 hypothetical protein E308F_10820 [Moorella sp. E308F]